MRTLCLNLQTTLEPSLVEIFTKWSPRVQSRSPSWIFLDIESTATLFGGEKKLLQNVFDTIRKKFPQATGALADTPYNAQALCAWRPFERTTPFCDAEKIEDLPIESLLDLEGLSTWMRAHRVEKIVDFFNVLGFSRIKEIKKFPLSIFRERWGDIGVLMWHRLHEKETQILSPLIPRAPFKGYMYLEEPVSDLHLLTPLISTELSQLFLRLESLGRFAKKITYIFHCEYSQITHSVEIEPLSPHRDLKLFLDLTTKKMEKLDFENPIREFEIEIQDQPEKTQQMNFFEPREVEEDQWRRLLSLAQISGIKMGFLQIEPEPLPEKSFSFQSRKPQEILQHDLITKKEDAVQIKAVFNKDILSQLRPSLLVNPPQPLNSKALSRLQILSQLPLERLETSWWQSLKEKWKPERNTYKTEKRDYFLAQSQRGQWLWIYKDLHSEEFFLQGYFD